MATIYYGADVSSYQGTITWSTYAANKDFVIIKAGGADSGLYTDSKFSANRTGARAQSGLKIGYYFFGDRTVNATTAANYFISILGSLNTGEILVLDIEGANYPQDDWAYTFVTTVYNYYGFYPFVYMSQFSPTSTSLSWPATNPLAPFWMANYSLSATDFSETTGNADSTWGSLAAPNYRILQYSDVGSIPGISGSVDLDSFYSPNSNLNTDWNALGYGGGSTPGSLTYATVTNPTMTYTQPLEQTVVVPTNSYDRVIYSNTWSYTATESSWPVSIAAPATGLTEYAYPVGYFSYSLSSGGSGTSDFGSFQTGLGGYGQFPGDLPLVFVQPYINSSGTLYFDATYTPGGSQTIDFTFYYALMAYPNGTTAPIPSTTPTEAFANAFLSNSKQYSTYRRIDVDKQFGTGNTTYAHGLGVVPNVLYWGQDTGNNIEAQMNTWASSGSFSNSFGIALDSTNVYAYVDSSLNNYGWLRLYKDN